ncbi:MAG: DegQ family serine endoprotease [Nitrospiria bacterium]
MPKQRRSGMRRIVFSAFLLFAGVIAGVMLSSKFRIVPSGEAVGNEAHIKPNGIIKSEKAFVSVAKSVTPVVVNISTTRRANKGSSEFPLTEPLRRFFKDNFGRQKPHERKGDGSGSGVIIESDGLIVTNNHVIEDADAIKVLLSDNREFIGTVVGTDPKSDLAVIRINAKGLPTIPWGDSSTLQVGEYILAVGNPFGLTQTVTMGIVSAVGRANIGLADYEDFIQTDAAINPGNSGGAMVNIQGELVGINTAIFTRSGGYMGIGFAVPSDMVRSIIGSLVKSGKVVRGWLGVAIQEVTPQIAQGFGLQETKGALVSEVMTGSPAEKAGFRTGDVILSFGGEAVEDTNQLRHIVAKALAGDHVKVELIRDQKKINLKVIIEVQPNNLFAKRNQQRQPGPDTSAVLSGVTVSALTENLAKELNLEGPLSGVVVMTVQPGSHAAESGLRRGDLIIEVNRVSIEGVDDYEKALSKADREQPLLLLVRRQDRTLFLTVTP